MCDYRRTAFPSSVFSFATILLYLTLGCYSQTFTGSVAIVYTGGQFVAALAGPSKALVLINDIVLSYTDFPSDNSIVLINRNVTVEGYNNTAGGGPDVTLDFNHIKRKLRLGPGVTLTLRHVVLMRFRDGSLTASPGIDLLLPSQLPSGATPSLVYVESALVLLRWCYPPAPQSQNIKLFVRPISLPGTQNVTLRIPQTGCSNNSAAPLGRRCWPSAGMYNDFGLTGADLDMRFVPLPNNYTLWLVDTKYACSAVMDESCVLTLGPAGCLYKMLAEDREAAAPEAPPDGSSRAVLVPVLAGVLGGAAAVGLLAGVVALAVLRQRRQRRQRAASCSGGSSCEMESAVGAMTASASRGPRKEPPPDSDEATDDDTGSRVAVSGIKGEPGVHSLDFHMVVTPLTPPRPDLALGVECGSQVTLLPVLRGRGSFGRVQEGMYGGQRVAVKLLPVDCCGAAAATAAAPPPPADREGGAAEAMATAAPPPADREGGAAEAAAAPPPADGEGAGGGGDGGGGDRSSAGAPGQGERPEAPEGGAERERGGGGGGDGGRRGGRGRGGGGGDALQTFAQEVEVLGRCEHPNVVRLLAACLGPPQPCLVMELMETSLDRLLHGPEGNETHLLPMPMVLQIAIDVVRGLEYLHPTIVHRDLKPANVLVNISGPVPVAKISDFGLSRMRSTVMPTKHPEAGTPAYMAPECFDTKNLRITHQADVYSFAVIVWEMLTGLLPWWGCTPLAVAYSVTLMGERLPLTTIPPERCPPPLPRLLAQCFDAEPRRRPAAAELVKELGMAFANTVAAEDGTPSAGVAQGAALHSDLALAAAGPAPAPTRTLGPLPAASPAAMSAASEAAFSDPPDTD